MGSIFTPSEYDARLHEVRLRMAVNGWSALVVVDPANLFYLTGYDAWSFYVPQCLIVPADGDPHLFLRAMDAGGAGYTSRLPVAQTHGYPEHLVHHPDRHPFDWISERARDLGLMPAATPVGVELDAHFFSPRGFLAMQRAFPDVTFVDSGELVNWVRVVKSPAEQDLLRVAGAIAERAMSVAVEAAQPGRRQCDVVADILAAQAHGVDGHGGDYSSITPLLPTGARAGTPHLTWSDEPLLVGEATTIELAGVHHRYHAPLARTVSMGAPSPRLASCADAVRDGMTAALDRLKPGATGADVHAAFTEVIGRYQLSKESRCGYSIGIGYPPDWGERTVSLRSEEDTVLAPGMAFHVILGMWMNGWGYELSEPVLVSDSGVELLSHLPQELVVHS